MITIAFTVNKSNVYDEVAKTSSYTGAKSKDDESAYDRIFTTDDDRMMLERFWLEACNVVVEIVKPFLSSDCTLQESHGINLNSNLVLNLSMPSSYDTNLNSSVSTSLYSFFVYSILSKWFKFTNKEDTESYSASAEKLLSDISKKIYYRKKPTRTAPV